MNLYLLACALVAVVCGLVVVIVAVRSAQFTRKTGHMAEQPLNRD